MIWSFRFLEQLAQWSDDLVPPLPFEQRLDESAPPQAMIAWWCRPQVFHSLSCGKPSLPRRNSTPLLDDSEPQLAMKW
jgi:hypothetical protein